MGSHGAVPAASNPTLSTDLGGSYSAGVSSFSTPASGSVDPFVQMGFDPEFLQRLNDSYGDLQDGMEGLNFEGGIEPSGGMEKMPESSVPVSNAMTAPISIPSPKQPGNPECS